MLLNLMLIIIILATAGVAIFLFFRKRTDDTDDEVVVDTFTLEYLTEAIIQVFNRILKLNVNDLNLNRRETEKAEQNKSNLRKALKTCCYGDIGKKEYVKDYIMDILQAQLGVTEEHIDHVIAFDNPNALSTQDKFEICLYVYKRKYGLSALKQMIKDFNLDRELYDEQHELYYEISESDIAYVYNNINLDLEFKDKLAIIAQRIYENYKGYGCVDELRDMTIDGFSAGVSGIPETMYSYEEDLSFNPANPLMPTTAYNSIWFMFSGKTIHLSCLGFKTQKELERVCKNIYRYNNPGQLSSDRGFIVNEMMDGARVVVMRPPFAESWGFWVRKFSSADKLGINQLIKGDNAWIAIETLKWCIKGRRVLAITGGQGTGKTTLLASLIQFVSPTYTLRIQELSPELSLRKLYPNRNIMSLRETDTVSGQAGLDIQKKTDGNINILGEVASDEVASWAVQMSQVGSDWTVFTHHAKTARSLIVALRNSIIRAGGGSNEKITEELVASAISTNLHLKKEIDGLRHIERFTEILPTEPEPYPSNVDDASIEYYERSTDRRVFETADIFRWTGSGFEFMNPLSDNTITIIRENLQESERPEFDKYLSLMYSACNARKAVV